MLFLRDDATDRSPPSGPQALPPTRETDIGLWLETHIGKGISEPYRFLRSSHLYLRQDLPFVRSIARTIREHNIALVHVNNGLRSGKPAIAAARQTRTPCVCHVRGFEKMVYFDRLFARPVNVFVYISKAVGQNYVDQAIPAHKGVVVHNVVNLDEFPYDLDQPSGAERAATAAQQIRTEFGWPSDTPIASLVGRLDWWKGHETFLEAVALAAHQEPNLRALIVGAPVDTPRNRAYHDTVLSMVQSLRLQDRVVFTGFRSDIPRVMAASDVIVLSSSTPEPFGRVVIEGMAACKPVIATAAGGVLDVIEHGVHGLLVPLQDPGAMAAAIVELVSDRQRARRMGRKARRHVERRFTLPTQVNAIQGVYSAILEAPRQKRTQINWQSIVRVP
jgi:glycosyltransferase involved in cell wall biosynthesis